MGSILHYFYNLLVLYVSYLIVVSPTISVPFHLNFRLCVLSYLFLIHSAIQMILRSLNYRYLEQHSLHFQHFS